MKKEKTAFYKSALCAYAVFTMGNAVIVLPDSNADRYTVWGLLIASALSLVIVCLLSRVSAFVSASNKSSRLCTAVKSGIWIITALIAVFSAADTFKDFVIFVSDAILTEIPLWLITVTFTAVLVYFFFKRQENILKFSLLCLFFIAAAVIFFFFATGKNFEIKNLYTNTLPDLRELKNSISPYFFKVALPSVILPFYHRSVFGERGYSACTAGVGAGLLLLCGCILPSVLLFTPELAGRLSYPYASAVSTVTVGKIFTRLDGFSYFIYFAAALIKINICLFTVKKAVVLIRNA